MPSCPLLPPYVPCLFSFCTIICHPQSMPSCPLLPPYVPCLFSFCTIICHPQSMPSCPLLPPYVPCLFSFCTIICHPQSMPSLCHPQSMPYPPMYPVSSLSAPSYVTLSPCPTALYVPCLFSFCPILCHPQSMPYCPLRTLSLLLLPHLMSPSVHALLPPTYPVSSPSAPSYVTLSPCPTAPYVPCLFSFCPSYVTLSPCPTPLCTLSLLFLHHHMSPSVHALLPPTYPVSSPSAPSYVTLSPCPTAPYVPCLFSFCPILCHPQSMPYCPLRTLSLLLLPHLMSPSVHALLPPTYPVSSPSAPSYVTLSPCPTAPYVPCLFSFCPILCHPQSMPYCPLRTLSLLLLPHLMSPSVHALLPPTYPVSSPSAPSPCTLRAGTGGGLRSCAAHTRASPCCRSWGGGTYGSAGPPRSTSGSPAGGTTCHNNRHVQIRPCTRVYLHACMCGCVSLDVCMHACSYAYVCMHAACTKICVSM